jgi:hypothetical protein
VRLAGSTNRNAANVLDTVPFVAVIPAPPEHEWFECEGGIEFGFRTGFQSEVITRPFP